jgi:leader peptidase (prepilin peptidase)/N-methyltransferase
MPVLVPVLALCAAAYGALAGSLLPRAAYRLAVPPETPRRAECPAGHRLTGPGRGWLGGARCPECATPVDTADVAGGRFFVTVCAAVCAALALCAGARPELAVWLATAPFGLLLAAVDARAQRLPDILTLPLGAAMAVLLGLAALVPGAGGEWTGALLGGAALAGGHFVLFLLNPRGMGFGDVKLAVPLGFALGWYGWDVLFAGAFLAFLLAAAYGLVLLLMKRAEWKSSVPFGPFLLLGSLAGLLLGGLAA